MSERGQASIEYLGVVALVAVVAAAGIGLLGGEDIAGAVVRQFHRALCVVSAGDCEEDRKPCLVSSSTKDEGWSVSVAVVHLGHHDALIREERSDGTVAITIAQDYEAGGDAGAGGDLTVAVAGKRFGVQASLSAGMRGKIGDGSTFVFANAHAADAATRVLSAGIAPPGLVPATRFGRTGLSLSLDGGLTKGFAHAGLHLGEDVVDSISTDTATGRLTHVLKRGIGAALSASVTGVTSADGRGALEQTASITTDSHARPLDLGIVSTGDLRGMVDLPGSVQAVAGALTTKHADGRRWVLEQHLDLTDRTSLTAAEGFLHAAGAGRPLGAVVARVGDALRERMDSAGTTDARVYATEFEDRGISGHVALGARLGGEGFARKQTARLLEAMQRGPDGLWHRRTDCVGEAA